MGDFRTARRCWAPRRQQQSSWIVGAASAGGGSWGGSWGEVEGEGCFAESVNSLLRQSKVLLEGLLAIIIVGFICNFDSV
jgi:hypothetical protein